MFPRSTLLPPSIVAKQKTLVQSILVVLASGLLLSLAVTRSAPLELAWLKGAYAASCVLLALFVRRLGLPLSAGIGLIVSFVYVTAAVTLAGGLRAPAAGGYLLIVILGGTFFGRSGWIACMLSSSAATAALIYAESAGLLPSSPAMPHAGRWISYTTLFVLSGLAIHWSLAVQSDALQQAAFELGERKLAEKALLEREARLRALHEYSPFPAFIWQKKADDFELTDYNRAADELTEHRAASMIGMRASKLYADAPEIIQDMQAAVEKGVVRQNEMAYSLRSTGSERLVSVVYAFVPPDLVQVTIEDVTARKHAEKELKRAREDAERSSRAKSEFLSAMSHELRTPLNVMLGFAQQLERSGGEPSVPVERILDAGWYLSSLLNDLLDMSRLETGSASIELGPVDLSGIVRECLQLLTPQASRKNLRISTDVPPDASWVLADPNRLRQVLINLAANSIKYNNPGGFVGLAARREDAGVRIDITDSGRGISAEMIEKIFEPFVREERGGTVEGSGIGLWVARELVEQMRGTIAAESAPGRGSVFTVTLRAAEKPGQEPVRSLSEPKLQGAS